MKTDNNGITMAKIKINGIKGMNDMLPEEAAIWEYFTDTARRTAAAYGFKQIRTPIVEATGLFCRGIGSLILRIINDKACVQELVIQLPQLCQRLIVLKVKPFDGCVHFTEAYKSNFLLHHKICSSLYPSAL